MSKRFKKFCVFCHKREAVGKGMTCAHCLLEQHMNSLGFQHQGEFRFHPVRKWRVDYKILDRLKNGQMVLIEIEGGMFIRGRHVRPIGFQRDLDKYNAAAMAGYTVLRFSTQDVERGRAKAFLQEHLGGMQS
jgi:very-short-patch-repair endonuclease